MLGDDSWMIGMSHDNGLRSAESKSRHAVCCLPRMAIPSVVQRAEPWLCFNRNSFGAYFLSEFISELSFSAQTQKAGDRIWSFARILSPNAISTKVADIRIHPDHMTRLVTTLTSNRLGHNTFLRYSTTEDVFLQSYSSHFRF